MLSATAVTQAAGRKSDNMGRSAQNAYSDNAVALLLKAKRPVNRLCDKKKYSILQTKKQVVG